LVTKSSVRDRRRHARGPAVVVAGGRRRLACLAIALLALATGFPSLADDTFRARLEELLEKDQRHRAPGGFSAGAEPQEALDLENVEALAELLERHGWPRISEVGEDAAIAAFLVIQHASLEQQERYLPALRERYEQGEAKGGWLAMLADRIRVRRGEPQLYGTQSFFENATGKSGVYAIEDPEHVNERRKALGMKPLSAEWIDKAN
jgi:hypothetical protein